MPSSYAVQTWYRDGLPLYARDYPPRIVAAKLPVVCLHGLTRNSKDFDGLAAWIAARGHRVVVPDMRGRGFSAYDPCPMRYMPATYAGDIVALLDELGIDRAAFIGTSMGGLITMEIAALWPDRVAGTVLNDVGPEASSVGLARIASYAGIAERLENWLDAQNYVRRINEAAFPHFGDDDWMEFARLTFRADGDDKPQFDYDPAIAEPIRAGLVKPDSAAAWCRFEQFCDRRPVALIRGALSDIVSNDIASRMQAAAPSLTVAEVPDVGHAPLLYEPAARAAVGRFLEQASTR